MIECEEPEAHYVISGRLQGMEGRVKYWRKFRLRRTVPRQCLEEPDGPIRGARLSGRSTHLPRRGRYGGDLGRTSGFPVQAGYAHHPQRSIPFMSIFPRGVNSPHIFTIGLPLHSVKRWRPPRLDVETTKLDVETNISHDTLVPGIVLVAHLRRRFHHMGRSACFLRLRRYPLYRDGRRRLRCQRLLVSDFYSHRRQEVCYADYSVVAWGPRQSHSVVVAFRSRTLLAPSSVRAIY